MKKPSNRTHAKSSSAEQSLEIFPLTPTIGAEVKGIDLRKVLPTPVIHEIHNLLLRHKLLVFPDQDITPAQQVQFARAFGELEIHPVFPHDPDFPELVRLGGDAKSPARENLYHSDVSWRETPSMGSILRCVECPPYGGDTIWVNMVAAYENLSEPLKSALQQLHAVHDLLPGFADRIPPDERIALQKKYPPQTHPVIRTHPETGEKILYVSSWTTHLADYIGSDLFRNMSELQTGSFSLLQYLIDQAKHPEYQVRLRWRPNMIAFWDNRATQHYAVQDYFPAVRRMLRATIVGDKPF